MYKRILKPSADFICALFLLILITPIFLVLTIMLSAMTFESPFFLQNRTGFEGKHFRVIKFKTMKNQLNLEGKLLHDELRMSSFTRFLRKSNLDEIPQLLNILKGDMSFIGPRPLPIRYEPFYSIEQFKRHNVRPGITGLAQVHGRRSLSWKSRFNLDVKYVEETSFLLDVTILMKTTRVFFDKSESEVQNGQSPDDYIPNFKE